MAFPAYRFSVAPMMELTDRHCRYFLRLISKRALLYTEMVTADAIIHGDRERHLGFNETEHPIALQLGGSDPKKLTECARIAEDYGYDEVNLNVGCPSDRVQAGRFGLCLMAEPQLVADCVNAMQMACQIPVTVKTRIGVDEQDSFEYLCTFVETVKTSGCQHFIVHARKGWLQGLSPKENRTIPPLDYKRVYQLKATFPELTIAINGGIEDLDSALVHLERVDGAMMGRTAYHQPYSLSEVDQRIFGVSGSPLSRLAIMEDMLPYIEQHLKHGGKLHHITRHLLGLMHGQPNARVWRRHLTTEVLTRPGDIGVVREAMQLLV